MSKTLVLAEKPSVGREIARVLGCRKTSGGAIHGDKYIVTWALGHLVTLADPEHYGTEYKTWSMETLPMLPKRMDLEVIKQTGKQYSAVRSLLLSKEVSTIVIATDAGREGELVARWIIAKSGVKKPIKRLWISSQTDKAIREGFANLKDGKEYDNLYKSAQARAEADWYVGLNVTRALTCKFNAQLSAGRVQTPTLALIVNRENEIRKFIPKDYYSVRADLGGFRAVYCDKNGNTAIFDRAKAEEIQKNAGRFTVADVKKTAKRKAPPLLYDLTELQRDANRIYGYSAKQTLSLMQSLYEHHKVLTYPRTDSRYLPDDVVPTLPDRIRAVNTGEYSKTVADIIRNRRKMAQSCINNARVSDHHAIIPTEEPVNLSALSPEERRIFDLVVKRFLTVFYPAYEYESMKVTFSAGGEIFTASGTKTVNDGWRAVYTATADEDEEEEGSENLPDIKKGDCFPCIKSEIKNLKTTPPPRYTEATLLSAMENPSKFIKDEKMKAIIKQSSGLGTPATRADIIEKLFSSFYVERSGKDIFPTSKGIQLISLVPEDLKQPELTAKWEENLDKISKGTAKFDVFIEDIKKYASSLVAQVKTSEAGFIHDNMTRTPCPHCGKYLLEVNGKRGKMLVCSDRECGYRENLSIKTNVRCPNCHKKMDLYGEGDNKKYICPCGYREKASNFHNKQKSGGKVSRQDMKKYMNNNTSAEVSPFELALKKAEKK